MVLQDTWIKHGTVRDQHSVSENRMPSDEEVIQAAKMSHSWEFIRRLPNGLDTILYARQLKPGTETASLYHPCHAVPATNADP